MTYFEVKNMDIEQMVIQYQEKCPRIKELSEQQISRVHKIIGSVQETVGLEHLVDCIADNTSAGGDGVIRCYVGFPAQSQLFCAL